MADSLHKYLKLYFNNSGIAVLNIVKTRTFKFVVYVRDEEIYLFLENLQKSIFLNVRKIQAYLLIQQNFPLKKLTKFHFLLCLQLNLICILVAQSLKIDAFFRFEFRSAVECVASLACRLCAACSFQLRIRGHQREELFTFS